MMKKTYTKPTIWVESFTMSQSIAAGCGDFSDSTLGRPSSGDKISCGWNMGNLIVWVDDTGGGTDCNWDWSEDAPFETLCYNNPNEGLTIFGS